MSFNLGHETNLIKLGYKRKSYRNQAIIYFCFFDSLPAASFEALGAGAAVGAAVGEGAPGLIQAMTSEMDAMKRRKMTAAVSHSPLTVVPSSINGIWKSVWKKSMMSLSIGCARGTVWRDG